MPSKCTIISIVVTIHLSQNKVHNALSVPLEFARHCSDHSHLTILNFGSERLLEDGNQVFPGQQMTEDLVEDCVELVRLVDGEVDAASVGIFLDILQYLVDMFSVEVRDEGGDEERCFSLDFCGQSESHHERLDELNWEPLRTRRVEKLKAFLPQDAFVTQLSVIMLAHI